MNSDETCSTEADVYDEGISELLLKEFDIEYSYQSRLVLELNLIAKWYSQNKNLVDNHPRLSDIKKSTQELLKVGKKYDQVLTDLPNIPQQLIASYHIPIDLMMEKNEHTLKPIYLRLLEDVHHMNLIAGKTLNFLQRDKGGSMTDLALMQLVQDLHDLFKKCTGLSSKSTYNEYEKRFEGKFLKFLQIVLPPLGINKTPASLSKLITKSLG